MNKEILQELALLKKQYQSKGPYRPYPSSLKNRLIELMKAGVAAEELSHEAAVPIRTLRNWQQDMGEEKFKRLQISRSPAPLRIFLGEKAWLEVDEDKLTPALLQKIRALV